MNRVLAILAALVPESVNADHRLLDRRLRRSGMSLRKWRLALRFPVILIIGVLAFYSIEAGADPTVVGVLTIATLAALAGVDLAELAAIYQGEGND